MGIFLTLLVAAWPHKTSGSNSLMYDLSALHPFVVGLFSHVQAIERNNAFLLLMEICEAFKRQLFFSIY